MPNRVMMGHCQIYTCAFDAGLEDMRKALETAVRIGNRHAEMFATQSLGLCLTAAGRYAEAEDDPGQGARTGPRPEGAALRGGHPRPVPRKSPCPKAARAEALALARDGPRNFGRDRTRLRGSDHSMACSRCSRKVAEAQEAALAAGEALLAKGSVGHNHFWFRRYAIERALACRGLGARPKDRRTPCCFAWPTSRSPMPPRSRSAAAPWRVAGRGDATEADEAAFSQTLSIAAEIDMRIDALGEALRRI